eukprot:8277630-Alexandrium_andersonii.AAC.1
MSRGAWLARSGRGTPGEAALAASHADAVVESVDSADRWPCGDASPEGQQRRPEARERIPLGFERE